MIRLFCLSILFVGVTMPVAAQIVIPFGPANIAELGFSGGNSVDVVIGVPTTALTLTMIDITVEGDLDSPDEFFELTLDGLSLGLLLNSNPVDDLLSFAGSTDLGSIGPLSASDMLSIDVTGIVGDGSIVLTFDTSLGVNAPAAVDTPSVFPGLTGQFAAMGELTFTSVPEPHSISLMLLSLGLIRLRRTR